MACSKLGGGVPLQLDLTDSVSIHQFVETLPFATIDVLIHNAGAVFPRRESTSEGFDAQLAVIYLGPFLLTRLLSDRLGPGARIINVASDLHRNVVLDWDDMQSERRYHFLTSYSRAELCKILYTYELARRWDQRTVNCLHPGGVRTRLFRNFGGPLGWLIGLSNLLKKSPEKGAQTTLYLATSSDVVETTGAYFVNCKPQLSSAPSLDLETAARLWDWTEQLLGLTSESC